jgi:Predicted nucleic-acid-binding protein implicated in transcription termination
LRAAADDPPAAPEAGGLSGAGGRARPERRCILSGARAPRAALVRLAVGPDGKIWPDLAGRLPGRGAWVGVDRARLAEAVASGRLAGALARALKGPPPAVPPDLAGQIEALLLRRLLDRLGLERRGGRLVFGAGRIEELARAGRLALLLHAADAAEDGARALDWAFCAGGGPPEACVRLPCDRAALSAALGRANVVHIGATDGGAATRIATDLARWQQFAGEGPTGADAGPGAVCGPRPAAPGLARPSGQAAGPPRGAGRAGNGSEGVLRAGVAGSAGATGADARAGERTDRTVGRRRRASGPRSRGTD